jgi:hypothetical protein
MTLFVTKNGKQLGPYSLEQVQNLVADGTLVASDWAWYEGLTEWVPISQIPGFVLPITTFGVPPPSTPPRAERPIAVWIICLFYFICIPLALLAIIAMPFLISLSPAIPESQRNLIAAANDVWHVTFKLINLVLVLAWAIQLFRLKRMALTIYWVMIGWSVVMMIFEFTSGTMFKTVSEGGTPVMVGAFIGLIFGWSINLALLWYTWHLSRKGVLN